MAVADSSSPTSVVDSPASKKSGKKKSRKSSGRSCSKSNKEKKRRRDDDAAVHVASAALDVDGISSRRDGGDDAGGREKRNKKRPRGGGGDNGAALDTDIDGDGAGEEGAGSNGAKSQKGKKKKDKKAKKKKDKKRKRSESVDSVGNRSVEDTSRGYVDGNSKKQSKKKKKKSKKERKRKGESEVDEKIVSSSAIEYYPEDLKSLQLKKNQEGKLLANDNVGAGTVADEGQPSDDGGSANSSPEEAAGASSQNIKTTADGKSETTITLLLFYQYVEPPWSEEQFQRALSFVSDAGNRHGLTGRMRVAREGMNCTLTGSRDGVRAWCAELRKFDGGRGKVSADTGELVTEFANTEFKLTDDLPPRQAFPTLHAFEVVELVNYGLAGSRAPTIARHGGTHLEPSAYHAKMHEENTVVIDVRNHYEAAIGRFDPPKDGARVIDPMMRKSTEFPMWLDRKETKEMLRGKQVLMYCTGGVRCERASALLKQKIDNEEDTKALGIKGVYQLQGGVDKYFKEFPEGGLWKGKNYTFDKRFAHAPPAVEAVDRTKKVLGDDVANSGEKDKKVDGIPAAAAEEIMGKCESCQKPWDMYRGKRRCPTCGVPSLICRECFLADKNGTKKLGREVRCDLCVAEDVRSKRQLREREERNAKAYEARLRQKLNEEYEPPVQRKHAITRKPKPNPDRITRLFLKNMCAQQMDEEKLIEFLHPAKVTHIQWLLDKQTGKFYGSAFIEVKTPEDAGTVLAMDGVMVLGRRMKVKYQSADGKDVWPIPSTEVSCYT